MPRLRRGRRGRRGVVPPQERGGRSRCSGIRNPRSRDACMRAESEMAQRNTDMQKQREMVDIETRRRG